MTFEKPTGREVRVATDTWPTADLELRADGDGMTFHGYAAVFDSWSDDLGGFREKINPGAFTRTLKRDRNIRMFLNHNADTVLATTKAGTLTLEEDERGLKVRANLPDTTAGRDLAFLLQRGDVDSMSFGFQVDHKNQSWSEDGTERTLNEVRLFEVSPVTGWPAYKATSASVRAIAEAIDEAAEDLAEAFRVLVGESGNLTPDQHAILLRAINSKYDSPALPAGLVEARAKWEALSL